MPKDEELILEYNEYDYELLKMLAINSGKTLRQLLMDSAPLPAELKDKDELSRESKIVNAIGNLIFCNEVVEEYTAKVKDVMSDFLQNNSLDVEPVNNHTVSIATYLSIIKQFTQKANEFTEEIINLTNLKSFIDDNQLLQDEGAMMAGDKLLDCINNELSELKLSMDSLSRGIEKLKNEVVNDDKNDGKDKLN